MTKEHIPPKSTGNDGAVTIHRTDPNHPTGLGKVVGSSRDGYSMMTLCRSCNNRGSRFGYVAQYKKWHIELTKIIDHASQKEGRDLLATPSSFFFQMGYDFMPARFARQAIGMILADQKSADLLAQFPQLATLVGPTSTHDESPHPAIDIAPLRLYLALSQVTLYATTPAMAMSVSFGASSDHAYTSHPLRWQKSLGCGFLRFGRSCSR